MPDGLVPFFRPEHCGGKLSETTHLFPCFRINENRPNISPARICQLNWHLIEPSLNLGPDQEDFSGGQNSRKMLSKYSYQLWIHITEEKHLETAGPHTLTEQDIAINYLLIPAHIISPESMSIIPLISPAAPNTIIPYHLVLSLKERLLFTMTSLSQGIRWPKMIVILYPFCTNFHSLTPMPTLALNRTEGQRTENENPYIGIELFRCHILATTSDGY